MYSYLKFISWQISVLSFRVVLVVGRSLKIRWGPYQTMAWLVSTLVLSTLLYLTVPYSTVINVPTRLESAISELISVLVYFKI